jgi:ABC-type branched-subunit amino acid transport system substrate-binding protein
MGVEGAAVAAQVTAQAIKASGAIVRVEPEDFLKVLARSADPLVVTAPGGFISNGHEYLFSYKGLAFFTSSPEPLALPEGTEVIAAQRIWIPAR